jgi:hypothetical protein
MFSLMGMAMLAAAALLSGCASAPPLRADTPSPGVDSIGTVWGDEYDGLAVDGRETARPLPRGFHVEHTDGETQSTRIDAFMHGVSVHARSYPSGEVGSVSWRGNGVVREITAGDFSPAIAEGALIGDPRTGGDLRAPGTVRTQGLAMRASTSTWSRVTGGGVVLSAGANRLALGGWQNDASDRVAVASVERGMRGSMVGVAGGAIDGAHAPTALSMYGDLQSESAFAAGELALSGSRVRAVARVVAGERREWSAIAIAGAGPANDAPLVFARKERWGAALERHDGWGWGSSRLGVSTLMRRDVISDIRRRRAFWDGGWRVNDDTRVELAARITREETEKPASGTLTALPSQQTTDDWRARATLRAERNTPNGWRSENAYRLEWVQNRTGRPGVIATWSWRMRAGPLDTKLSASAHALGLGQVSYSTDAAPPGLVEYSAVTGKGASLAASVRLWIKHHAWLSAAWSQTPPTAPRVWITLGART